MNAYERPRDPDFAQPSAQSGEPGAQASPPAVETLPDIRIGKAVVVRETDGVLAELFTMTIGEETIQLLPFKNWSQLDSFKWRARGVLPGTPAGLEIAWDHLKVAGETASPWDPEACGKLEKTFNEWLALERQTLEMAKQKVQTPTAASCPPQLHEDEVVRFEVDLGKAGGPRLKCMEGSETAKVVALNLQGLNALIAQGFMRKPAVLKVGALHDWVELDGQVFRFKEGTNWAGELEKALNERYVVGGEPGAPQDVGVFPNPASPTGFDIQFPATPSGVVENRKRHLNEETVQLLQDPERCHVLRKGIIAKLAPPMLVFKVKTSGGGESYLESGPDTVVLVQGDDGQTKQIDLSQPVDLLKAGARELTGVFNHPAINRRARLAQAATAQTKQPQE